MIFTDPAQSIKFTNLFTKFLPFQTPSIPTFWKPYSQTQTNLNQSAQGILIETTKQILMQDQKITNKYHLQLFINLTIIALQFTVLPLLAILHFLSPSIHPALSSGNVMDNISIGIIMGIRAILLGLYILNYKHRYRLQYLIIKLLQIVSLFLIRQPAGLPIVIFECISDIIYALTQPQRCRYFDSRLDHSSLIKRLLLIQLCIFSFIIDYSAQKNANNLFLVCISSIIWCILIHNDPIFDPLLKRIQQYYSILAATYITYLFIIQQIHLEFIQQNLFKVLILVIPGVILISIYSFLLYSQKYKQLPKIQYLNFDFDELNQQQKINYIWEGITYIQTAKYSSDIKQMNYQLGELCLKHFKKLQKNKSDYNTMSYIQKMRLIKQKYPYQSFLTIFQNILSRLIFEQGKNNQCFRLLSIFYVNKYVGAINQNSTYQILLNSEQFIYAFYQLRQNNKIYHQQQNNANNITNLMVQVQSKQKQINNMAIDYVHNYIQLIKYLCQDSINLQLSSQYASKVYHLHNKLIQLGSSNLIHSIKKPKLNSLKNSIKYTLKIPQNIRNHIPLTSSTVMILNLIRLDVLGLHEHVQSKVSNLDLAQLINQERPILVISGESQSLGQIISVNKSTLKFTNYTNDQLVGSNMSILLPQYLHASHSNILQKSSINFCNRVKDIQVTIFIIKKTKHCAIGRLHVKSNNSFQGKKWIAKIEQLQQNILPIIIYDLNGKIIQFNQRASLQFNLFASKSYYSLNSNLVNAMLQNKQICFKPRISDKVQYTIKLINQPQQLNRHSLPKFIIAAFKKHNQQKNMNDRISTNSQPILKNQFKFYFNFSQVKYTFQKISHSYSKNLIQQYYTEKIISDENSQLKIRDTTIRYGEDIDELIYDNGEIEFRQNKTENHKGQTYPPHQQKKKKERQRLSSAQYNLPSKNLLQQIINKLSVNIQNSSKIMILLISLFVVTTYIFLCADLTIMSEQSKFRTNQAQIYGAIEAIRYQFEKISIYLSQNVWGNTISDEQLTKLVTQINKNVQEIELMKEQLEKLNQEIFIQLRDTQIYLDHQNSKDRFSRIQQDYMIQLKDFLNQAFQKSQQYNIQAIKSLFNKSINNVLFIYFQSHQIIQAQFVKIMNRYTQIQFIFLIVYICISVILIIFVFKLQLVYDRIRLHNYKTYGTFSNPHLNYFQERLKCIRDRLNNQKIDMISLKNYSEINDEQIEDDPQLFHYTRLRNRQKVVTSKYHKILIPLIMISIVGMASCVQYFIGNKIENMDSVIYLQEYYIKGTTRINQIWLNKMVDGYKLNNNQFTEQFSRTEILQKLEYLINLHYDKLRVAQRKIYQSYFQGSYTQNFILVQLNTLRLQFCQAIQQQDNNTQCSPLLSGYLIKNIESYLLVKNKIVVEYLQILRAKAFQYPQQRWKVIAVTTQLRQRINQEESIYFKILKRIITDQIINQRQNIILSMILSGILLTAVLFVFGIWSISKTKSFNQYLYEPLKIITTIFPVYLLDKNWFYKKFYHQTGIKAINSDT